VQSDADLNAKDNFGETPLHSASRNGHLKVVEQIVATEGDSSNANDNYGQTPLHYACEEGHLEVVN